MESGDLLAIAALTKPGQPVAQPLVIVAANVLWKLLGRPVSAGADKLAAMLSPKPQTTTVVDVIARWKSSNMIRVLAKVSECLDKDDTDPAEIPRGFLLPALEAAGYAEDDDLRGLWAQLLISGSKCAEYRHPVYVHVLRQLSSDDAALFRDACRNADIRGVQYGRSSDAGFLPDGAQSDAEERLAALDLAMLWTKEPPPSLPGDGRDLRAPVLAVGLVPSQFGAAFRRAVMPPAPGAISPATAAEDVFDESAAGSEAARG
jgi:hypothetical protein